MRRKLVGSVLLGIFVTTSNLAAAEGLKTEDEKTLYAIGLAVSRSLNVFSLSPSELEIVKQGITGAQTGKKPEVDLAVYNEKVQALAKARRKPWARRLRERGRRFLRPPRRRRGRSRPIPGWPTPC